MKILKILSSHPNATIPELAQKVNKSESAVSRALQKLQKEGYLKRISPDKGVYWKVIKKDSDGE